MKSKQLEAVSATSPGFNDLGTGQAAFVAAGSQIADSRDIVPLPELPRPHLLLPDPLPPAGVPVRAEPGDLTCRTCGEAHLTEYIDFGRKLYLPWQRLVAQLYFCPACGHRQFLPDLKSTDLAEIYGGGAYFQSEAMKADYAAYYKLGSNQGSEQLHALLRRLGVAKGARVHEFGAGTGLNMWGLQKVGYDASGSDWSAEAVAFGREHGNEKLFVEDMTTIDKAVREGVRYDVIVSNAAIEHTPNPVAMLKDMARLCTPETFIIVRTNNGDTAVNRNLGMLFDGFYYFPHHLHYFSARSLNATGRRAGLKPVLQRASEEFEAPLADAALGEKRPGETDAARVKRAAALFETTWLEMAFVLEDSPYKRDTQTLPAIAQPSTVPPFQWDSHADFFSPDTPWRQNRCLKTDLRPLEQMVYSTVHNYWYYGYAFIGVHDFCHYDDDYLPMLSFEAPESGLFEFEITLGNRYIQESAARFIVVAPAGGREEIRVPSLAPVKATRRIELRKGECVRFVCENEKLPNLQRTICLVGVRRVGAQRA